MWSGSVYLCLWVRLCRVRARDWISRGRKPSSRHSHAGSSAHMSAQRRRTARRRGRRISDDQKYEKYYFKHVKNSFLRVPSTRLDCPAKMSDLGSIPSSSLRADLLLLIRKEVSGEKKEKEKMWAHWGELLESWALLFIKPDWGRRRRRKTAYCLSYSTTFPLMNLTT